MRTPEAFSIIAATCYGNRGAQAMLETVVGRLGEAKPELRFNVFTYYPDEDRRLLKNGRVTLYSSTPAALVAWLLPWSLFFGALRLVFGAGVFRFAPSAIRALAGSTALVDLAGVAFIDGREKFLPFNILTLLPAMLLGVPVVKMPQATGPFKRAANRISARAILPICRVVWARGDQTRIHLEALALPGLSYRQADDIAFNHKDAYSLTDEGGQAVTDALALVERQRADVRGVIGICPSSVLSVQSMKEGGNYESVLSALLRDLAGEGFLVVLFPNATRASDTEAQRNNDLPLLRRIAGTVESAAPAAILIDIDINAAGIKRIIAAMDIVLVSRFHAMVGALSLGVPSAVLGWSHKYAEVMARFGLQGNVMDYKTLSGETLRQRVETVFEERAAMRDAILLRLPEVKSSAEVPVLALLTPSLGAELA